MITKILINTFNSILILLSRNWLLTGKNKWDREALTFGKGIDRACLYVTRPDSLIWARRLPWLESLIILFAHP